MSAPEPQVHLAIGSRVENIELAQMAVEAALQQLRLDDEASHHIGTAVREAVANAIEHGNGLNPDKRVEIDFGLEGGEVVVRVTDEGVGFDPGGVPNPLSPENLLRPDGRGLLLMHEFMDEIDYTLRPEGGMVVTLRKRVGSPPDGAAELADEEERR